MSALDPLSTLVEGIAAGALLFSVTALLLWITGDVRSATGTPARWTLYVRTGFFLGAMSAVEELIFRAGLLGLGERLVGFIPALVVSSVLFSLSHSFPMRIPWRATVNITLIGLLLGIIYWRFGIWAAVGVHWGWNGLEWGLGFTVSGEHTSRYLPVPRRVRKLPRTPYGPEASWAAMLAILGALVVVLVN